MPTIRRRTVACKVCTRPIIVKLAKQPHMCTECHNRALALETLETVSDPAERATLVDFAQQMREDAADKGGRFEGEAVRNDKPEPEPAYMPEDMKPKVGRPAKPPKVPKEPPPKSPRGRKPRPGGRMVMVGMRVPPETQAKLTLLGRDWLILQVAKAG